MSFLNNMFGSGAQQAQGLLGGAQGMTLEEIQQRHLAQQYTQNLAQSMMNTGQQAAQNIYSQMAGAQASQAKPFNPNEIEAYKVPLSTLVTLWQAKFGDEWVSNFEDAFWHDACERLRGANKLECAKHTWYRIKEDA